MKKKEYLIGDVAAITGVSRDTLRFYEKKGIISVQKKENGYRYYSEDDISRLSSIFYHRRMNIGLDELEHLWSSDNSFEVSSKITTQQIETEKQEILKHQQALIRLNLFQEECQKVEQNLNRISVRTFPKAYIIKTCASPQEGLIEWFCQTQKNPVLDMLYTYNTLSYPHITKKKELALQHSSLLLYEDLKECLDSSFGIDSYPKTNCPECLYTIIEAPDWTPGRNVIDDMIRWGAGHHKPAGEVVFSDFIMTGVQDGSFTCYLEIYIPIISS